MKKYKIKQNNHYSGFHIAPFFGNSIQINGRFSNNCMYKFDDVDQYDINKLAGFSRMLHHKDSARVGWRCTNDKIELVTYCYVGGKRLEEKTLAFVSPGENFSISLEDNITEWVFIIKDKIVRVPKNKKIKMGYLLFPYFGGNKFAPHDMEIDLRIKKLS